MSKTFKTPKGTELPIMNLQGKDYLQVAHRILWFREEKQDWVFSCSFPKVGDNGILCKAEVVDQDGKLRAVAHAFIAVRNGSYEDMFEKVETAAIGRALGHLGYGTQFIDHDEKIADSPIEKKNNNKYQSKELKNFANFAKNAVDEKKQATVEKPSQSRKEELGSYVIGIGKKYKGMELKSIKESDIIGHIDWFYNEASKAGKPVSSQVSECASVVAEYYGLPPFSSIDMVKSKPVDSIPEDAPPMPKPEDYIPF